MGFIMAMLKGSLALDCNDFFGLCSLKDAMLGKTQSILQPEQMSAAC